MRNLNIRIGPDLESFIFRVKGRPGSKQIRKDLHSYRALHRLAEKHPEMSVKDAILLVEDQGEGEVL